MLQTSFYSQWPVCRRSQRRYPSRTSTIIATVKRIEEFSLEWDRRKMRDARPHNGQGLRQRMHGHDRGGGRSTESTPSASLRRRTPSGATIIIALLMVFLAGIALLCRAYSIGATDPGAAGYQSILSQLTAAVMGRGWFYYVTIGSILAVLALSANTSYADFPRLTRAIAMHDYRYL